MSFVLHIHALKIVSLCQGDPGLSKCCCVLHECTCPIMLYPVSSEDTFCPLELLIFILLVRVSFDRTLYEMLSRASSCKNIFISVGHSERVLRQLLQLAACGAHPPAQDKPNRAPCKRQWDGYAIDRRATGAAAGNIHLQEMRSGGFPLVEKCKLSQSLWLWIMCPLKWC